MRQPVPEAESVLGHHAGKGLHDLGGLGLLVVGEDAGNNDDHGEDDAEVQVVIRRLLQRGGLDGVGEEAEEGAQPEQHGNAAKQRLEELDPLRGGGGRGEAVEPIPLLVGLGLGLGEPRLRVAVVAAVQLLHRDLVVVLLQLLLQVLKIPLLGCKKRRTN